MRRRFRGAEPVSFGPASRLWALPARPYARSPSPRLSAPSAQPSPAVGLGGPRVTYTSMPTRLAAAGRQQAQNLAPADRAAAAFKRRGARRDRALHAGSLADHPHPPASGIAVVLAPLAVCALCLLFAPPDLSVTSVCRQDLAYVPVV